MLFLISSECIDAQVAWPVLGLSSTRLGMHGLGSAGLEAEITCSKSATTQMSHATPTAVRLFQSSGRTSDIPLLALAN